MMDVHPDKPTIDGKTFCDTYGMRPELQARLIYDGMVYLTDFNVGNTVYGGQVIARDHEHARRVCEERGFGERVIGQLEAMIPGPKPGSSPASDFS